MADDTIVHAGTILLAIEVMMPGFGIAEPLESYLYCLEL